jgi:hypothetical protein
MVKAHHQKLHKIIIKSLFYRKKQEISGFYALSQEIANVPKTLMVIGQSADFAGKIT